MTPLLRNCDGRPHLAACIASFAPRAQPLLHLELNRPSPTSAVSYSRSTPTASRPQIACSSDPACPMASWFIFAHFSPPRAQNLALLTSDPWTLRSPEARVSPQPIE